MKIILPCVLVLLLTGCSEYSKMLRNEEAIDRLEYAKKLFELQEYNKAVKILEPYYQRFKNTKCPLDHGLFVAHGRFVRTFVLPDEQFRPLVSHERKDAAGRIHGRAVFIQHIA